MRNEQTVKLGTLVCRMSDDEIRIPPPPFFGQGYLFEGKRQVLLISKRLLWRTSYIEVPFSNINYIAVTETYHKGRIGIASAGVHDFGESDRYDFKILIYTSGIDTEISGPRPALDSLLNRFGFWDVPTSSLEFSIAKVSVSVSLADHVSGNEGLKRSMEVNKGREPVTLIATAIGRVTGRPVRNA